MAEAGRRPKGDDRQLTLAWVDLERYPGAVCCHGTFILDEYRQCQDEIAASIAEFEAGVRDGKWDEQGYTPAERRAKERRERERDGADPE